MYIPVYNSGEGTGSSAGRGRTKNSPRAGRDGDRKVREEKEALSKALRTTNNTVKNWTRSIQN